MENINAEKVKKALECCNKIGGCKVCPYSCNGTPADNGECVVKMSIDALALIKSQEKQVEDYRQELAEVRVALAEANYDKKRLAVENDKLHASCTELARVQEENERLERICESYTLQYGTAADKEVFLKQERADTVHQMQSEIKERCIKGGIYPAFVASTIDQIAKEMLKED